MTTLRQARVRSSEFRCQKAKVSADWKTGVAVYPERTMPFITG